MKYNYIDNSNNISNLLKTNNTLQYLLLDDNNISNINLLLDCL